MKLNRTLFAVGIGMILLATLVVKLVAQPAGQPAGFVSSSPVYVPDYSHAGQPLPDGVLDWDALLKSVDVTDGDDFARFVFTFTNVSKTALVTTNIENVANQGTSTTNYTPSTVTILSVRPSCGCTTAELPPTPWMIQPGMTGEIKLKVNLEGKAGVLIKTANVTTDHGQKTLNLRINIHDLPPTAMTDEQKMAGITASKADRQAIFKGDCASCHIKNIQGKYGAQLYNAVCGICHEAENRATMVPDLSKVKGPTNPDFWRTWITLGKPGSLMPAFANSQGGPLTDEQIASLAIFLNQAHPSQVAPPQ